MRPFLSIGMKKSENERVSWKKANSGAFWLYDTLYRKFINASLCPLIYHQIKLIVAFVASGFTIAKEVGFNCLWSFDRFWHFYSIWECLDLMTLSNWNDSVLICEFSLTKQLFLWYCIMPFFFVLMSSISLQVGKWTTFMSTWSPVFLCEWALQYFSSRPIFIISMPGTLVTTDMMISTKSKMSLFVSLLMMPDSHFYFKLPAVKMMMENTPNRTYGSWGGEKMKNQDGVDTLWHLQQWRWKNNDKWSWIWQPMELEGKWKLRPNGHTLEISMTEVVEK